MTTTFSLKARWILPGDGEPVSGGIVSIRDGAITAIDDSSTISGPIEDLGDVVLIPGLVNAHTHLEFSDLTAPLGEPGTLLPTWIRQVIGDRKRDVRNVLENIQRGLQESLYSGVTAIGDIATIASSSQPDAPTTISFQEVIAFSVGRVDSAFAEVIQRVDSSDAPGISPHAPYTVNPQLLERLVEVASQRDLPIAMHLAESREELQLLADGSGPFQELLEERSMWDPDAITRGTTILHYLQMLSRAPRSIVVHGNYLAEEEIDFLAKHHHRMSLIYCPRTHAYFDHDEYPLRYLLDAGVHVALGTDSRASSPDLSLLEEMRYAWRTHSINPVEALRLGTESGAACLGLSDMLGTITPGKRANLITLPCPDDEPHSAVLEADTRPTQVWLRGVPIL